MSDRGEDDPAWRSLARIARTLGLPLDAFYRSADDGEGGPSEAEEREVITLFRALRDPEARRRCLDLLRTMVQPATEDADQGS